MSKTAIVTGAGGLVGSAAVEKLIAEGYTVLGFENNMRRYFFGEDGSTQETLGRLKRKYMTKGQFIPQAVDIRDYPKILDWVKAVGGDLDIVIHAAAQPSHDWAAREPHTDFSVNALGTLNVLEAVRNVNKDATVCCISTSKVYGDNPNSLMLTETRDTIRPAGGPSLAQGDHAGHVHRPVPPFPVRSVQGLGRHHRAGVRALLPDEHPDPAPRLHHGTSARGVPLHGFLSYLMKCALSETEYTIIGYHGKQVRCNIHADDLVDACLAYHKAPHAYGAVYNIGGGRESACSVLEAIASHRGDHRTAVATYLRANAAHWRPHLVDQRHRAVAGGLPGLEAARPVRDAPADVRGDDRERSRPEEGRVNVAVCIPTITGREHYLKQAIGATAARTSG
jgi:CDP-paratose 2-epimerase